MGKSEKPSQISGNCTLQLHLFPAGWEVYCLTDSLLPNTCLKVCHTPNVSWEPDVAVTATSATLNAASLLQKSEPQTLRLLMAHEMWWKEKGGATGLQRVRPLPVTIAVGKSRNNCS